MSTYIKAALSASSSGRAIKVVATATPGTLLHTAAAVTGDDNCDEVWLWATNSSTSPVKLTIEWGGVTSPDDTNEVTLAGEAGWVLIVPGFVLQNSLLIRAFADTTNVVLAGGYVNKIRV